MSEDGREQKLAGNGVFLARERELAGRVQGALERLYRLDRTADVHEFLRAAEEGERESLLVRERDDGSLELALRVPTLGAGLDSVCQLIEGVSHFVYLSDRAMANRATTQLEMELQAEVDKYVVLASSLRRFDLGTSSALRERLYDQVSYAHEDGSLLGERYRVANDVARAFVRRLEQRFVKTQRFDGMRGELRQFFRMGQAEKLRFARAA